MNHSPAVTVQQRRRLLIEIAGFFVSIIGAVLLVRSGVIERLLDATLTISWVGPLIAGLGYSSIFTVAPATVALAEISLRVPLWEVALFGGLGAVVADQILYRLMRSELASHLEGRTVRRWSKRLARSPFRWIFVALGGLIIASPLPDEIGLSIMGVSHLPAQKLIFITFPLNAAGIWLIGAAARQF